MPSVPSLLSCLVAVALGDWVDSLFRFYLLLSNYRKACLKRGGGEGPPVGEERDRETGREGAEEAEGAWVNMGGRGSYQRPALVLPLLRRGGGEA